MIRHQRLNRGNNVRRSDTGIGCVINQGVVHIPNSVMHAQNISCQIMHRHCLPFGDISQKIAVDSCHYTRIAQVN